MSPTYKLEVVSDATQLAQNCAERIAALIDLALDERDRAHIALSGGTTPAAAYRVLQSGASALEPGGCGVGR